MANALGIVKKSRPGDDVDAYCGKCKEVRTHAIVALNSQSGIEPSEIGYYENQGGRNA